MLLSVDLLSGGLDVIVIQRDHALYLGRRITNKAGAHLDLPSVGGMTQKQAQTA